MSREPASGRVLLRPFAPADLLALIQGEAVFAARTGFSAAAGLRDFFVSGDVSTEWLRGLQAAGAAPADPWVHGFLVVSGPHTAIGTVGFKGPPDSAGQVEIAYAIAPAYQGQGLATAAAAALLEFARRDPRVRLIRAHTAAETNASGSVLRKLGFSWVGPVQDPDDGLVWRWETFPQPAA